MPWLRAYSADLTILLASLRLRPHLTLLLFVAALGAHLRTCSGGAFAVAFAFTFDVSCTGRRGCAGRQQSSPARRRVAGAGDPDWKIVVRRADRDIHAYTSTVPTRKAMRWPPIPPLLPPPCSTDSAYGSGSSRRQNDFRSHIRTYENRPMRTSVLRDNKSGDLLETGAYGMTDKHFHPWCLGNHNPFN